MAASSSAPGYALVLLRVGLGALLLREANELWLRGVGPWLVEDSAYRIAAAPDWYAGFGNQVVLRFPTLFAWLIAGGTAAAGAAYFVGAAVRPASVGLLFLMANAAFAGPLSKREYVALTALAALVCMLGDAGRRVGLDPFLPRWLSWSGSPSAASKSKPKAAAPR